MFVEGEWIEVSHGKTGFVVRPSHNSAQVYFPKVRRTAWISTKELASCEEILPEVKAAAKKVFIELALMTKDREWFEEVTK